jgi:hypothetical protein
VEPASRPRLVLIGEDPEQASELCANTTQPTLAGDRLVLFDQPTYGLEVFKGWCEQRHGPGSLVVHHEPGGGRLVVIQLLAVHS